MDVDEPRAKKAKKGSTTAVKKRTETPDEAEDEERTVGNMDAYRHMSSWEGLIKSIDTVERKGDELVVYFTL